MKVKPQRLFQWLNYYSLFLFAYSMYWQYLDNDSPIVCVLLSMFVVGVILLFFLLFRYKIKNTPPLNSNMWLSLTLACAITVLVFEIISIFIS